MSSAVFCLSVPEHVDDLDEFLYHLSCLTAPGGLLFLTFDCCGCASHDAEEETPPDEHHFHWIRRRIFGQADLRELAEKLLDLQFGWLGERDFTSYQPQLYGGTTDPGYSFASLALVKRR